MHADAALRAAYAECERIARTHYENFPVASWLVPARMRPHIAALYAFARTADDFADEGRRPDDERLRLLDDWQNRLHACVICPCRSSTICSARFVRISRRIAMNPGTACLITAGDRQIPLAVSCCVSPGIMM